MHNANQFNPFSTGINWPLTAFVPTTPEVNIPLMAQRWARRQEKPCKVYVLKDAHDLSVFLCAISSQYSCLLNPNWRSFLQFHKRQRRLDHHKPIIPLLALKNPNDKAAFTVSLIDKLKTNPRLLTRPYFLIRSPVTCYGSSGAKLYDRLIFVTLSL